MKTLQQTMRRLQNGVLLLTLLLATFCYAMFQGGFVSWFLFYSFLPFGIYATILYFYNLQRFEIKRELSEKECMAGHSVVVQITIQRSDRFPLPFLVIEDASHAKTIVFLGWKRTLSYTYTIPTVKRGEIVFSHIHVRTGDVLGVINKKYIMSLSDTVLVYPRYHELTYTKFESRFDQGASTTTIQIAHDATTPTGIRNYKPGDRFSWIDWKASARKQTMMTKEFEQQRSHDIMVLMDRTPSSVFESVVTATTSLLHTILKYESQVFFTSIGQDITKNMLHREQGGFQKALYHMTKVQDDANVSLSRILANELKTQTNAITCVILTGTLSTEIQKAVKQTLQTKKKIIVIVTKEHANSLTKQEYAVLQELRKYKVTVHGIYTNVTAQVTEVIAL